MDGAAAWRRSCVCLLLVLVAATGFAVARADGPVSVSILSVDDSAAPETTLVMTVDNAGHPVTQLTPQQITINEDGRPATVESLQEVTQADTPLALILALDVSGSMSDSKLGAAQAAATTLVANIRDSDSAAVISFANAVRTDVPLTKDKTSLRAGIAALTAVGDTSLYDAVAQAARQAASSGVARRAVVLLTDGRDSGGTSTLSREQSLTAAADGGALFYVVGVGADVDGEYLQELAMRSRGRYFAAQGAADIQGVYTSLEQLLRSQLVVRYRSAATTGGPSRSVSVTIQDGATSASANFTFQSQAPAPTATAPATPLPPTPAAVESAPSKTTAEDSSPLMAIVIAIVALGAIGAAVGFVVFRRRRARAVPVEALPANPVPADPTPAEVVEAGRPRATIRFGDTTIELYERPLTIGWDASCDVRIERGPEIAPRHARVWWRDGRTMLHSLVAGFPTSVAGHPVEWGSLEDGDEVMIGAQTLTYRVEPTPPMSDDIPPTQQVHAL